MVINKNTQLFNKVIFSILNKYLELKLEKKYFPNFKGLFTNLINNFQYFDYF